MFRTRALITAAFGVLVLSAAALTAQNPGPSPASDFIPETTFTASSLSGWHTLGAADWTAQNGEIVGTPRSPAGGWLLLDKSYQDVYFFSRFRCAPGCKGGLLFRLTDAPGGGKTGVFVSLDPQDLNTYRLNLDAEGRETSREPLNTVSAFTRTAPPPARGGGGRGGRGGGGAAAAAGGRGRGNTSCGGNGAGRGGSPKNLPIRLPELEPPAPGIHAGEWNTMLVSIDADVIRPWLNGNIDFCGSVTEDRDAYGPVGLYAGGAGEVRYRDVSFKDLHYRTLEKEVVSPNFRMQRIDDYYYAWGAAVADFNRDGNNDIVAGPWIYYGPEFTKREEMYVQGAFAPSTSFTNSMVDYAFDFTGDGWPDVLAGESRAMHLYVNPQGANRRWDEFFVLPQITSEAAVMADLDKDGRPEVVFGVGGAGDNSTVAFAGYDPADATKVPWTPFMVSEPGLGFGHSIGAGDINGDGRPDILQTAGWWEQPAAGIRSGLWTYHPVAFGQWGHSESAGGAEMMVYDVNGDGLNDVVTGLNAHGFGLAWFEQKRAANGDISFERHMIMGDFTTKNAGGVTFSEMHASNMADMDGDGIPDYVTGKRVFSHQESYVDADPLGQAVLYVFRTVRNRQAPGGAEFVPELVHNRSGVGSQFTIADVDKDGTQDIVTSTNRGTFVFFGRRR